MCFVMESPRGGAVPRLTALSNDIRRQVGAEGGWGGVGGGLVLHLNFIASE